MTNFGPPVQIQTSAFRRGKDPLKIKRGGTGKASNAGSVGKVRPPIYARRNFQKPSKKGNGEYQHLPPVASAPIIWNPADPFIIQLQATYRRPQAAWRTSNGYARTKPVTRRMRRRREAAVKRKQDEARQALA